MREDYAELKRYTYKVPNPPTGVEGGAVICWITCCQPSVRRKKVIHADQICVNHGGFFLLKPTLTHPVMFFFDVKSSNDLPGKSGIRAEFGKRQNIRLIRTHKGGEVEHVEFHGLESSQQGSLFSIDVFV